MLKKNEEARLFADISLVENPTSEQLKEIAISSAKFMQDTLQIKPRVAMLSYSTHGSAKGEMADKVRIATELTENSGFLIDGEMQTDTALDIVTAKKKGITSGVGGNANVLIFPDLNAGNIGYKLVARLGGYTAVGPIMLNFNHPVNDLSRGCTVDEIVNTVAITKLQI
jgi:phosphate acetyltransferase